MLAGAPGSVGTVLAGLLSRWARPDPVLLAARRGRWRLPWAIAGVLLTALLLVSLLYGAVEVSDRATNAGWVGNIPDSVFPIDPAQPLSFLLLVLSSLPFLIAPLVTLAVVHRQSWRQAFSYGTPFRWDQFLKTATAFLVVSIAGLAAGLVMEPGNYQFKPQPWSFLWWGMLALGVVFVQSIGEEVLFRGYLLRVLGALVPLRLPVTAAVIAIFVAGHLSNEDIQTDLVLNLVYFIAVEIISYALLFRTRNLAASAGLHWMNNVIALLAPTVPGQPTAMGLIVYTDPVYAAGGSRLFDLLTHAGAFAGVVLLLGLLYWRRSPLHLGRAAQETAPDAPEPARSGISS